MVARKRPLIYARVDWLRARLNISSSLGSPPPRWPPSEAIAAALRAGELDRALQLEDDPSSRYVVLEHLDWPHLWLARDDGLSRDVVLKLERDDLAEGPHELAWEGSLLARLHHPHILMLLEAGPGYLVLERLDGDLRVLVGHRSELILSALSQAARGLDVLHEHGVCHGDIKAENILVKLHYGSDGTLDRVWAKLGDLGAARICKPLSNGQRAGRLQEDHRAFAIMLRGCLVGRGRAPRTQELITSELHALLGSTSMSDAGQRWADTSALVGATECGRGTTAAEKAPVGARLTLQPQLRSAAACADGDATTVEWRQRARAASVSDRVERALGEPPLTGSQEHD